MWRSVCRWRTGRGEQMDGYRRIVEKAPLVDWGPALARWVGFLLWQVSAGAWSSAVGWRRRVERPSLARRNFLALFIGTCLATWQAYEANSARRLTCSTFLTHNGQLRSWRRRRAFTVRAPLDLRRYELGIAVSANCQSRRCACGRPARPA